MIKTTTQNKQITYYIKLGSDLSSLAFGIFIFFLSTSIGNRIKDLKFSILKVVEGKKDRKIVIRGHDDLSEVAKSFNLMLDSLNSTTVSKDYLDNILGSLTDMLFVLNPMGIIEKVNHTVTNNLFLEEAQILGKCFSDFIDVEEGQEQLDITDYFKSIRGMRDLGKEVKFKTPYNQDLFALLSISFLKDENNMFTGYVCVAHDITASKKVKEELELEKIKTIQASKLSNLGEMAAGVAHEINNPMAIIHGYVSRMNKILKRDEFNQEKFLVILDKINHQSERVSKIVNGLRTFSREGSNDLFEKTPLEEIINESFELCVSRFKYKGIELTYPDFDKKIQIECQMIPLTQVIVNVLNNAHDAIKDLPEKWIKLEIKDTPHTVIISVIDSGTGIPLNIQNKILQPFYTTKPLGEGTGLGLGIAVGIINNHKGEFRIDNNHKNTKFDIILPKVHKQKLKTAS